MLYRSSTFLFISKPYSLPVFFIKCQIPAAPTEEVSSMKALSAKAKNLKSSGKPYFLSRGSKIGKYLFALFISSNPFDCQ